MTNKRALLSTKQFSTVVLTGALVIFVAMTFIDSMATATTLTPQQRAQGLTAEDLAANKKKLINLNTNVSSTKETRWKFANTLTYGLRQDMNQRGSPDVAFHRLTAATSITLFDRAYTPGFDDELANEVATLNLSYGGEFTTVGKEIDGTSQDGVLQSNNFDGSVSKSFEMPSWSSSVTSNLDLVVGSVLPVGQVSSYASWIADPYVTAGWALGFLGGRYNLVQTLNADFPINVETHVNSSKEVVSDNSLGYSITTSARLGAGFRFTLGGNVYQTHYIDGSATMLFSNVQMLTWTRDFITISLRYANGARPEDRFSSFWFTDEYRRLLSLGVSLRF